MKRPAKLIFTACLAAIVAAVAPALSAAAEIGGVTQDLVNVKASGQVMASWTRQPDSYVLQVVMEKSKPRPKAIVAATQDQKPVYQPGPATSEEMRRLGIVNVAEAVRKLVPQNGGLPPPTGTPDSLDRSSFFVGNTIANLRGLDPWIPCGRTLVMIDGRRVVAGQPLSDRTPPVTVSQPYPFREKERRVEVWLLKADGTQIPPETYICAAPPVVAMNPAPGVSPPNMVKISYSFSAVDSALAVAAAIRIDDDYFVEKLQPLGPIPAAQ